jgi:branched-chain amino acid transport system substrate-binding protein
VIDDGEERYVSGSNRSGGRGKPRNGTHAAPTLILGGLLLAMVGLVGCGGGSATTTPTSGLPKEIVIGAAIAKTGVFAPYDASIAAIEQLVEQTNASGGIDGHRLRVVQADTHSEPQQAVVAAQKVIEEGADVVLSTCEALTADAEATVAEEHGELNFTLCENAPGFGPPTTGRLAFSANPSLLSEASAGASFLHRKGVKHPFLFRDTSIIYGKADCSAFQQSWEHLGGTIAGTTDFENEDESVATQINELRDSHADAVVMCSYPPGGAAAIKQIRAAGIDVPILGPSSFDGTFWLKGIPDTNDIYATSNGSIYDPPSPATARLLESFKRAGIETDISTNLLASYAAGQLIFDAIEETGSVDGDKLADALEAKPHKTIVGTVTYTPDDHYPTRTWPIYGFAGAKEKLVTEVKPRFIPKYGG